MDTVPCEVVQWVEVAKDRGRGRRGGESTSSKKGQYLTNMADH